MTSPLDPENRLQFRSECSFATEGICLTSDHNQDYFRRVQRYNMAYPQIPGIAVVKKDAQGKFRTEDVIPFELLHVDEGQLYRRKLDPAVVAFIQSETMKKPDVRKKIVEQCLDVSDDTDPTGYCRLNLEVIKSRVLRPRHWRHWVSTWIVISYQSKVGFCQNLTLSALATARLL